MSNYSANDDLDRYARSRHRHMGRGELLESDVGLGKRLVAALQERGIDESDLDELVYEAAGADSTRAANTAASGATQERWISAGERRAAEANNGGLAGQVAFLMKAWGAETVLNQVRGLLRPATPTP